MKTALRPSRDGHRWSREAPDRRWCVACGTVERTSTYGNGATGKVWAVPGATNVRELTNNILSRKPPCRPQKASWAPRGLQRAFLGVLQDIAARRPIQPKELADLINRARAAFRAASDFERAFDAAEQPGPHQLDRFIELALQVVDTKDVPAGLRKAVNS